MRSRMEKCINRLTAESFVPFEFRLVLPSFASEISNVTFSINPYLMSDSRKQTIEHLTKHIVRRTRHQTLGTGTITLFKLAAKHNSSDLKDISRYF